MRPVGNDHEPQSSAIYWLSFIILLVQLIDITWLVTIIPDLLILREAASRGACDARIMQTFRVSIAGDREEFELVRCD